MLDHQTKNLLIKSLKKLVALNDSLRDAGLQDHIIRPRIVAYGSENSGKSSVLESIIGLNFLPIDQEICTSRLLEIKLFHSLHISVPYALFEGSNEVFTDFDKVREMIVMLTKEKASRYSRICKKAIILSIFSRNLPDIDIIDLPGFLKFKLSDPSDLTYLPYQNLVNDLLWSYSSDLKTITIGVFAANVDICISGAYMMFREPHRFGRSTLGVMTKLDISYNEEKTAKLILELGYIGLKNRSKNDIKNHVKVETGINQERDYFLKHEIYSGIPPIYLGTQRF